MSATSFISTKRVANALLINLGKHHVTWWHRAAASAGRLEVFRARKHAYASLHLWGWSLSVSIEGLQDRGENFHRTLVNRYLPWADYNCSRTPVRRRGRGAALPWRSRWTVRFFGWLLAQPGVMEALARDVENSGAFCHLVTRAVEGHVEDTLKGFEVDADSVHGLGAEVEQAVEAYLEHAKFDADSVDGLERAIQDILDEEETTDRIVQAVAEYMTKKLAG